MNIKIIRTYDPECVEGIVYDDQGNQICYSLELPDKGNKADISCVPEGSYSYQKLFSSHLGWVYRLANVPDRDLIDIHSGNTVLDILGCIIVGTKQGTMTIKGKNYPAVLNSRDALAKLFSITGTSGMITITSNKDNL